MTNRMRFGVNLPNAGDPATFVSLAVDAERAGWDGFFLWDHIQISAAMRPDVVDPWVVLGAMATVTERMTLGTMVTPIPRRRPWKLAKEITTLDHLSGGRFILGVGLGAPQPDEFGAFGEPTSSSKRHAAMLDEALPLLDTLLRGEPVDHDGEHYRVHAQLAPAALQSPRPPIWVGTLMTNPRGIARAGRWDGIAPQVWPELTPDEVATLRSTLGPGKDIVAPIQPGLTAVDELAAAGATWAIIGKSSPGETLEEVRAKIVIAHPAKGRP